MKMEQAFRDKQMDTEEVNRTLSEHLPLGEYMAIKRASIAAEMAKRPLASPTVKVEAS
ncbi:Hypothetical protein D9617_11g009970 [Elsinoe fawcettii]|nr:Hypothetical protein D9617_11g009970 [Elsinoe fawcettii]